MSFGFGHFRSTLTMPMPIVFPEDMGSARRGYEHTTVASVLVLVHALLPHRPLWRRKRLAVYDANRLQRSCVEPQSQLLCTSYGTRSSARWLAGRGARHPWRTRAKEQTPRSKWAGLTRLTLIPQHETSECVKIVEGLDTHFLRHLEARDHHVALAHELGSLLEGVGLATLALVQQVLRGAQSKSWCELAARQGSRGYYY